jgi:hypothetical protein
MCKYSPFNALNAELNPICHFLALLGAHHILHVSRIRVKPHRPTDTILDSFVACCFESVSHNNGSCYSSEKYSDTRLLRFYRT